MANDWIGPYKILETLGEGGMGIVYLAEQTEPLRRRVALKVIRPGMDSSEVVARFETERQALALMSHPHIARIHDAGQTEEGRPYFVMEYVVGEPITTYCKRRELGLRDRLALFLKVCDGIQHAHQKGVMHRDLKPGNVLVTDEDGSAHPKIIDFGVAKATDQRLTEKTLFTEFGRLIGTPEYMSPEQASGDGSEVDTRTDIYSLGVLLYELLVGKPPFESATLRRGGYSEVERIIREEEPQKPSTRVGSSAGSLTRALRGDLDWIVMKALEKNRARRYQDAFELKADLVHHLQGEPVSAGPPGVVYRVKKFVGRNRISVGAVATIVIILAAGLLISLKFSLESMANAMTITENEGLIRKRIDQILRLSDRNVLEDCRVEEESLWPAVPAMEKRLEAWLKKARKLIRGLPDHRRSLESLRLQLPGQPADLSAVGLLPPEHTALEWQVDNLEHLVRDLESLGAEQGLVVSVEKRLRAASTLRERSIDAYATEWSEACRSIANPSACPAYGGLRIAPQLGLVPLGQDPGSGLWEFAHLPSGAPPKRRPDGQLTIGKETGLVLVLIPGRTFLMGAVLRARPGAVDNVDRFAQLQEGPVHEVTLDSFFLSKFEMTQAQWMHLTESNPSTVGPETFFGKGKGITVLHPVESVSWDQCGQILFRIGLTIPTEAQWEYATRGGGSTPWPGGQTRESLLGSANLADRTAARAGAHFPAFEEWPEFEDGFVAHAPVGSFRSNSFGLHDVAGNVAEWCRDKAGYYDSPVKNGDGERLDVKDGLGRIIRGGGFSSAPSEARSSARSSLMPGTGTQDIGIRPARPVLEGGGQE